MMLRLFTLAAVMTATAWLADPGSVLAQIQDAGRPSPPLLPGPRAPARPPAAAPAPAGAASGRGMAIVAVVNGDVVTNADVSARAKLFAISVGLPISGELLERLRPQIAQQLVDERLRLQEVLRQHVIIREPQIAKAIGEIEGRNNMPPGALGARLANDGVSMRTLVDQIRVQLGWTELLRKQLGSSGIITEAEIREQAQLQSQSAGRPEYRLGEIFIPISNPARTADAQRFADAVIAQLRSGASFPVAAAQFSQSQTALSGGDLGWLQTNQMDPEIAKFVPEMPPGAISNPIKVAGGFSIVQMRGKRELGRDQGIALTVRQLFLPFPAPYNSGTPPTPAQAAVVEKVRQLGASARSCAQLDELARANNSPRPANPGNEVNLANVNPPQFRQVLASLPLEHASQPLVAGDGVSVVMVCTREAKVMANVSKEEIQGRLLTERIELASRQLQQDLRRRATIENREGSSGGS